MNARPLALVVVLLLLGIAFVRPAAAGPAAGDRAIARTAVDAPGPTLADTSGVPSAAAVSPLRAGLRLAVALAITLAVMLGMVAVRRVASGRRASPRPASARGFRGRWLGRWMPDATEADRISVLSRSYLGPRESVGVVGVGHERFLLGITSGTISLLARLPEQTEPADPERAAGTSPALERPAAIPNVDAAEFRATAVRLRERLAIAIGRHPAVLGTAPRPAPVEHA